MAITPLIITDFDQAIADSPHKGFGHMSRVDIESYPGAIKAGKQVSTKFHVALSTTFTADAGTDICTRASGTLPQTGTAIYFTTTGTLPAGLSTGTVYFVIKVSSSTFKVATDITNALAGTQVDITGTGTGTHSVLTVEPGIINRKARDERNDKGFYLDSNGRVWYEDSQSGGLLFLLHNSALDSGTGEITGSADSGGIVTFKQNDNLLTYWLIVFRGTNVDYINIYSGSDVRSPSWTNGWDFGGTISDSTLNNANNHYAIVGQDDIIYFCDGRYVGSIKEATEAVFAPGTTSTYTGNDQALDLPANEKVVHLEELGINLLIAGNKTNKIYPWDRKSDTFNLPIRVPEKKIYKLKNIGGVVFILAGRWGNIYITQGIYARHFKKIPTQLVNNGVADPTNPVTWGDVDELSGSLLFGAATQSAANSGVYLLHPDGRLLLDQTPSDGTWGAATMIDAVDNFYIFGYNGGADGHDTDRYTNLECKVESAFYRVATKTEKATYSKLEVVLAKPASAGNVQIGYREDTSSAFTTIDTFTADGLTTIFQNDGIGLTDIENIQIQALIDDDVELVVIRLIP